jgi:hypothetical protein
MNDVSARIDGFLKHDRKRVLVLKGKWGVGKTFFWKRYIGKRREDLAAQPPRYAYVSLFGVRSVEDIQNQIIAFFAKESVKGFGKVGQFAGKHADMFRELKAVLEKVPWMKEIGGMARGVSRMLIDGSLICIDDVERKAPDLSMREVLGFVSSLREDRDCRVVVIFNEDELHDKADIEALEVYREKVIDESIHYDPSVEDNVRLIYGTSPHVDFFIDLFRLLDLKNIRVMKQAQWAVEYFTPFLEGLLPALQSQILQHVVFLSAFFHERSLNVSLRELALLSDEDHVFNAAAKQDARLEELQRVIQQYRFYPQDYDSIIADYIENGSCDEKRFQEELRKANEREQRSQVTEKLRAHWELYRANFQVQDADLISRYRSFLDEAAGSLSEREFDQAVKLLQDCGYAGSTDGWRDAFIMGHLADFSVAELQKWLPLASAEAPKAQIRARQEQVRAARTMSDLFHGILNGHWGEEEVSLLDSYTTEEFYEWMRTSNEPDLLQTVWQLCRHFTAAGVGSKEQSIKEKVCEALRRLATVSKINEMRVRNLFLGVIKEPAVSSDDANATGEPPE